MPLPLLDISVTRAKPPPYMKKTGSGLFAQIKLNSGRFLVKPLDTGNPAIASARMAPLLGKLIAAGELDREARVCRFYLPGRCPQCGRPFPGAR